MSNKALRRSGCKRNWGRGMRIDGLDRLEWVIELIKTSLPIGMSIDLNHAAFRPPAPPLPYDPRRESSVMIPAPLPILASGGESVALHRRNACVAASSAVLH